MIGRFGKRHRRLLAVLLAALTVIVQLPLKQAGAEFAAPMATPQPTEMTEMTEMTEKSDPDVVTTLFLNSHETEEVLAGEHLGYRFTPSETDTYVFQSFPGADGGTPEVTAQVRRLSDGRVMASAGQAAGFSLSCGLEAGETYELEIMAVSAGGMAVEVMQEARGRCFGNPISLPGESIRYAKTIVRARDVHWFSFVAPVDGWYSVRTEKTGGDILDTKGYLMDSQGRLLSENDDILFPGDVNFLIQHELTAGETYFVRISAFSNMTGAYRLVLTVPGEDQALPADITLSRHDLIMDVDGEFTFSAQLKPKEALPEIVYASSNSEIVSVEPDGTVRAVSAGTAEIWAISYAGVRDRCLVTVRPVEVTGMAFSQDEVSLRVDEQTTVFPVFTPSNASKQTARYESSDESVVMVSESGVLTGISKGSAVVTAISEDGGFADAVHVRVEGVRPVYRALVLGEQGYENDARVGGKNTAQGVADMLKNQSLDGSGYQVLIQMDSTREQLLAGISEAFAGAKETDISLFYINCHGAYEDGVAYLRLHDESRLTVDQLEAALRSIPGKVVVILDFCQSGAFIGAAGAFDRFTGSARDTFAEGTALTSGKYVVITSASSGEDSYRRSFSSAPAEESTAAIMGRSLCEGAGWDLIYDRSVSLKADRNRDKQITVQEIYEYTKKRVMHYLEGTGVTQTVHVYPAGDQTVIFGRN